MLLPLLLRALGPPRPGLRSLRPPPRLGPPPPARSFRYGGSRLGVGGTPPPPAPPRRPPALRCLLLATPATVGLVLGGWGVTAARCREAPPATAPRLPPPADPPQPPEDPPFDWPLFWVFLRPQLLALSAAVALALGAALLNVGVSSLLGGLVDAVTRCARGGAPGGYLGAVGAPALRLLLIHCLQAVLTFGYLALLARVGERVAGGLRLRLFCTLLRQDMTFFDSSRTGQLLSRLTADVQEFKSCFKLTISQGLRSGVQIGGCLLSLSLLSPKLTGLLLLALPPMVGTGTLIGHGLRSLSRRAQEQVAKATTVAEEALGNVRTVRAFAVEEQQEGLFREELDRGRALSERLGLGIAAFQGLSGLALNAVVLGTIFVGGSLMAAQELSPGDLTSFLVAAQTVQRSMAHISVLFGQAVRGLSAGARVLELLRLEPGGGLQGGVSIPAPSLRGHICFDNVSFSYPSRPGYPVLRGFTLTLPPGKTLALVGPSGGGKSTVGALLERFYEPSGGSITLDGHELRSLDPSWLRGRVIGYISQEPVLFATSILENIRLGRPGATEAEVVAAAKMANADDFIRAFPQGYHTVVGERGAALSGGQKQRVAIARALLKDPPVLVLDEATSALDAGAEGVVQEALERASAGRTVLLIAHRLSTLRGAHLIALLQGGRVAEVGTHEELLRKGGLYAQLIRGQTQDGPQGGGTVPGSPPTAPQ